MRVFGIKMDRRTFIRWKIYIDRARMYIGYISFIMIAFMFLNDFKDQTIRHFLDENKWVTYPVMMVVFLLFSLILGRLDTKPAIQYLAQKLGADPDLDNLIMSVLADSAQPEALRQLSATLSSRQAKKTRLERGS